MANRIICDGFKRTSIPPHTDKMVIANYQISTNFGRDDVSIQHFCGECFRKLLDSWMIGGFPTEETVSIERV